MNLLSASDPQKAITTHPAFMNAIIQEVMDRGGKVLIADSPGGLYTEGSLKKAYRETGILEVAEETGAELNYDTRSHKVKHPDGRFLKSFNFCDYIDECDIKIAVPKIKTHMFCGLTCASKIMFGVVPGTEKVRYHTRFLNTLDFSRMLHDLTDACEMDLFLVDGIIGMEGKGPARGDSRQVGTILSGKDPRKLDLYISRMVGLDPKKLPVMKAAQVDGLIEFDEDIHAEGNGANIRIEPKFKPAKGGAIATNPPRFLRRIVTNISTSKPHVSVKRCIGCGVCADNCAGDDSSSYNHPANLRKYNPDQADSDGDGAGDKCDLCPCDFSTSPSPLMPGSSHPDVGLECENDDWWECDIWWDYHDY
jgi:uncharacterized protein (DUF362 family)